jgi:hypothetical protein
VRPAREERRGGLDFVDDKAGKPLGNSGGDLQMLRLPTVGEGARFALLARHTDAEREWAWDRESTAGRQNRVIDEAAGPRAAGRQDSRPDPCRMPRLRA